MCVDFSTRFGCGWSRFAIVLCGERGGALSVGLLEDGGFSFLSLYHLVRFVWFSSFLAHTNNAFSFTDKHTNGRALGARTIGKANVAVVGGAFCAE